MLSVIHHSLITQWTCDLSVPSWWERLEASLCEYVCTQYCMFKYKLWLDSVPTILPYYYDLMESDIMFCCGVHFQSSAYTVPPSLESNWALRSTMTVQNHSLTSCHNADLFGKYVFFNSKIMWFKLQLDMKSNWKLWKGWKEPLTWQRQTPTINRLN